MSLQQEANGSKSSSASSLDQAAAEAAEEYLPKAAKIKTAEHLHWLQDTQALGAAERKNVQRFTDERVFGDKPKPGAGEQSATDAMGNIIVCDNVYGDEAAQKVFGGDRPPQAATASESPPAGSLAAKLLPCVLAAGVGASGGAIGMAYRAAQTPPEPRPIVEQQADTDTQYRLDLVSPGDPQP